LEDEPKGQVEKEEGKAILGISVIGIEEGR
jgi:hypothetical protein